MWGKTTYLVFSQEVIGGQNFLHTNDTNSSKLVQVIDMTVLCKLGMVISETGTGLNLFMLFCM